MLAFPLFSQNGDSRFVIVIDPGHGGRDSGTPGTGRYKATEKNIALDVSLALGKLLEKDPNIRVAYTRTTDVYHTVKQKSVIANKKEGDLFISIHCNAQSGGKGSAYGSETFVLGLDKEALNLEVVKRENSVILFEENYEENYQGFDPNNPESLLAYALMAEDNLNQSIELARSIENEFINTAKRKSRGVKQAGFLVLVETYMPSVLVELGFLTHKREEDYLNSKKGKQQMAKSLYNAVIEYVKNNYNAYTLDNVLVSAEEDIIIETKNDVVYKVQIAAGSRKLETKPYNFKGLKGVTIEPFGNGYKYFYGNTTSYENAKKLQRKAKAKGYTTCFIVAYKNGEQVKISDL
jgi:N-acetylmuramoyl-L-alanine amidase